MSKISKISLLLSGLFAVSVVVTRIILNGWVGGMWAPLGLSIALFTFAVIRDWRLMFEFFTLKTTKHGMNMGALILTMLVLLVAVNYLAVSKEKKWDWTSEGLNSLSEQSVKAVENLKADTELVLLYRTGENEEQIRRQVQDVAALYTAASSKLKLKMYNALQRPDLAKAYEYTSGPYAIFLVQKNAAGTGDRHMKVEEPTEEEITRTLLRFARDKKKVVYFVAGHGEHDLSLKGPESISQFKSDLELSYDVKALELFKDPTIPEDADLVVIAGPRQSYLPAEIEALRAYAKRGGRIFAAIDPDSGHGLAGFTKTFGIEFQNNYVLDPRAMIPGAGNIAAIGNDFSTTAEATRPLRNGFTLFLIASALKRAPDAPKSITLEDLVKSDETPVATDQLTNSPKVRMKGPHTLAMMATGKLEETDKEFQVIIAGDGDFLRDNLYRNNLNRDFAMNAVSSLAKDMDLVSIRPKAPKGTQLMMTQTQLMTVLFGFLLPVPILMFFTSGLLWWRRKAA
ncbi:MAG: Gldg family protein [Bdellovibrionales bacterium]|nr:Gldg family protein [Bdellovibrionales bacterium]